MYIQLNLVKSNSVKLKSQLFQSHSPLLAACHTAIIIHWLLYGYINHNTDKSKFRLNQTHMLV